jgi:hypothetical protein
LDRCEDLIESRADCGGRARKSDEQSDRERTDEGGIDPSRTCGDSDARTPGDRTVTIA